MKKKLASKSAFFNPRVLTVFALCVIGGLLALGVAFSASLAPHAASPKEAANPAIPVTSSALAPAFDQGPVQSQQKTEPNVLFAVLYDQNNNTGGASTVSQNFEASQDAADSQAADDFAVPGGETWTIQQVVVTGVYFNGAPPPGGPAVSFNVFFYAAVATLPGPVVTGGTQLNATYTNAAGVFTITLPTAVVLPTGKYWVSVQANMDFGAPTAGEWGWTDRSVTNGVSATWQNPGGGFAAGCLTWGRRGATCGIDAPNPDQMFQLLGTSGPGAGTPSPTPTATATIAVSPTATPTPGCENYVVTNTALTFVPGTTDIGNHTDDGVTVIALPFPVKFYGNTYTAAAAGSNGFLNLSGTFVNTFYTGCLPERRVYLHHLPLRGRPNHLPGGRGNLHPNHRQYPHPQILYRMARLPICYGHDLSSEQQHQLRDRVRGDTSGTEQLQHCLRHLRFGRHHGGSHRRAGPEWVLDPVAVQPWTPGRLEPALQPMHSGNPNAHPNANCVSNPNADTMFWGNHAIPEPDDPSGQLGLVQQWDDP